MQVQFAAASYQSRNLALDAQRSVNFFSEQAPAKDAESLVGVFGCPGLSAWAMLLNDTGPVRGYRILNGLLYVVSSTNFYSVAESTVTPGQAGVVTRLNGDVAIDGFAPVSITDNGTQIVFVTGASGYLYQASGLNQTLADYAAAGATSVVVNAINGNLGPSDSITITLDTGAMFATTVAGNPSGGNTIPIASPLPSQASIGNLVVDPSNTFMQITAPGFYAANTVTFMDGYFIFERAGTNECFFSGIFDGTTYNGTDFISAESNPGRLKAVASLHQMLILVCERHLELWQDVGANDSPFQLLSGAVVQRGTAAALSVIQEDNSLFFIGNDYVFYRLDNYQPVRLSTHVIETAWTGYGEIADAFCFVVVWEGHKFIHITFPSAHATWVYDIATGLFHERESWGTYNVSLGRWRGNCAIQCYGQVLIGDGNYGQIGLWDYGAFTEFGETMRGLLTSPPIHKDRKRIFMSLFETYWETGVGTAAASAPTVLLDWSDDGARTWSKAQRPASIGAMGGYKQRTRWWKLGQSRTRTLRLTITDPVRRNLIGTYLEATTGQ